jgi:hypothetical protein
MNTAPDEDDEKEEEDEEVREMTEDEAAAAAELAAMINELGPDGKGGNAVPPEPSSTKVETLPAEPPPGPVQRPMGGSAVPAAVAGLDLGKLAEGAEYVGELNAKGQRHGYGVLKAVDGTQLFGCFHEGVVSGYGVLTLPDRSRYEGKFEADRVTGYGFFYGPDE